MHLEQIVLSLVISLTSTALLQAQGPPLTADKPKMLGSKSVIIKTLSEFRNTSEGTYNRIPIMIHYLPTSNSLVTVHIPWTSFSSNDGAETNGS
ncbi:MAG: hypothetical protein ACI9FN_000916 [Saprospiraceae bacterium]|jgi:hypothetical protein